jgi:hypothetical protein
MQQINPGMVREVIETKLDDRDLESSIQSSIALYNSVLLSDTTNSPPIPTDAEIEIKRYLAAHFVSIKDNRTRVVKEKIGDAYVEYGKDLPDSALMYLKGTRWGQTAILFDPTGKLEGLGQIPPKWFSL